MSDQDPADQSSKRVCRGLSKGLACRMPPLAGSDWCWNHDPAKAAARAEGRKLGGERRKRVSREGEPTEASLRSVDEVLDLLERAARDALQLDLSPERCRVLVSVAGQALTALGVGSIEDRLAALEQAAGVRRSA